MVKQIPLKYFAYSITPSAIITAQLTGFNDHHFPAGLPLVDIKFDFEQGKLILEGDWYYMMASNRHVEQSWFGCHGERVRIDASISPSIAINLADKKNDGSGFALEGTLQDGENQSLCFGLLLLENTERLGQWDFNGWNLTFYLYDSLNSECEIRMKLPLYADPLTL